MSTLPDVGLIGRRLAERREKLGHDQGQIAELAGVSRAYISRLERGAVPAPKITELAAVAEALDLSLHELLRQPNGTRTEVYAAECAEITAQLESAPPEVAETVMAWFRQSVGLLRWHAREN